jgi:hypothetical protein
MAGEYKPYQGTTDIGRHTHTPQGVQQQGPLLQLLINLLGHLFNGMVRFDHLMLNVLPKPLAQWLEIFRPCRIQRIPKRMMPVVLASYRSALPAC